MFNIVNMISNAIVLSATDRQIAEDYLKLIDTIPSSHEIVEVANVAE